jgi:hypothetical protein
MRKGGADENKNGTDDEEDFDEKIVIVLMCVSSVPLYSL